MGNGRRVLLNLRKIRDKTFESTNPCESYTLVTDNERWPGDAYLQGPDGRYRVVNITNLNFLLNLPLSSGQTATIYCLREE